MTRESGTPQPPSYEGPFSTHASAARGTEGQLQIVGRHQALCAKVAKAAVFLRKAASLRCVPFFRNHFFLPGLCQREAKRAPAKGWSPAEP